MPGASLAVPLDAAGRLALHHGEQWAAETISRDSSADDHVVAAAKRSIDALNEVRVNLISEIAHGSSGWCGLPVTLRCTPKQLVQ
ncbi:DUF4254 domain-containing protein [Salinispora arenicola]|nr:DUF4254 domain-containing protein [Salinispora arenicola]